MDKSANKLVFSIDIGGTYTKLGLVEMEKGIEEKGHVDTSRFTNEFDFAEALYQELNKLRDGLNYDFVLEGLGVGVPGVTSEDGVVNQLANIPFLNNVNLVQLLENKFNVGVHLSKDSNIAAIGEGTYGEAKGMRDYILLTLGTGLGCSVVVDGKILIGETGLAGEFGHVIIEKNGRECGCGRFGCLEAYVSSTGLVRNVFELLTHKRMNSPLRDSAFNGLTSKSIFDAAKEGDLIAQEAFHRTGQILGENIANLFTLFDSEAVILTGGLAKAREFLEPAIIAKVESNTLYSLKNNLNIRFSSLEVNDAALLGAASLVWNDKKEISI